MSADIRALSRQLSDIILTGVCKDIRDSEDYHGFRGGLLSALHGAITTASSVASLLVEYDEQHPRCGCGAPSIGHDMLGNPICAGCRALEAAALEELAAVETIDEDAALQTLASLNAPSISFPAGGVIPTQPKASDR